MTQFLMPPIHLIVLAGGSSLRARRSDSTAPKQFRALGGNMLFIWSLKELLLVPDVVSLTVAVPEPWQALARSELEDFLRELQGSSEPSWRLAPAGDTRTASTWQAASTLAAEKAPKADDLVAVHDAARPFATQHLLRRLAAAAMQHGAAVPGVPVPDTIVQLEDQDAELATARYLQRDTLQAVQTPQVFRWEPFLAAHRWCHERGLTFTDDGGLLAAQGLKPVVVMGEAENWKITTEADWKRAEPLLLSSQVT